MAVYQIIGEKNYELVNHLGNVNTVISDKAFPGNYGGTTNAVNFDGVNDHIVTASFNPGLTTAQTVQCWVRTTATSATVKILAGQYAADRGAILLITAAGKASFDGRNGTATYYTSGPSTTSITDGAWHFVTGTMSNGQWKIYVDGVLESTSNTPNGDFISVSYPFYIGRTTSGAYFQGALREVSYWDYAKTPAQIALDRNTLFAGTETGLKGYWPLTSTTVPGDDVSTANHDGTLTNGAAAGTTPNTGTTVNYFVADIRQATDYSPFGVQLEGRNFTLNGIKDYSLGFQGQEEDDEIAGEGNSVNYTYRMHSPRVGRFFTLDPLAAKFPHNSPYAFSENRVVDCIELEGLEAFFIHGTTSSPDRWTAKSVKVLSKLTNNKTTDTKFSWEDLDGTFNKEDDRHQAAERLVEYIQKNRVGGEEITLIGHSHGGNVAIQAAKLWHQKTGESVNLITIATPTYEGNNTTDIDWEDPGTPNGKKAINDHIHIWNDIDGVQGGLAGDETYKSSPESRQYQIPVDSVYNRWESLDAHSFDVDNPQLIDKFIKDGTIKKLTKVKGQ